MNKIFRLFISSTFSDFKKERELLQTVVFPQLLSYCESTGYQFQPIDLRWGVQTEAQLDQKTLEVCLSQVMACKHFPHPNFLVMLGHRYGWVPLPYAIEQREFRRIHGHLALHPVSGESSNSNIALLDSWYRHDRNYLYETPDGYSSAYVLAARSGEFTAQERWFSVENRLRTMLQAAAEALGVAGKERDKYFLSATEHEVIEGILEYRRRAQPQTKRDDVDSTYVFGLIRGEDEGCDGDEILRFRQSLQATLPVGNTFLSDDTEESRQQFANAVLQFLKASVDVQIARISDIPALVQEQAEQQAYLDLKLTNFSGRESVLALLDAYIERKTEQPLQPLVIYGPSGIGKSSIIAKAIQRIRDKERHVVFRFVGATPASSSSRSLLASICQECISAGIASTDLTFEDNGETFTEFCLRVRRFLETLASPVVIAIDALDQLANLDDLTWLPDQLAPGVKLLLSILNDSNYQEDSRYFGILKHRAGEMHEIPALTDIHELLDQLLLSRGRTLQARQRDYVLKQYAKNCSPLYLKIVLEEIVNWESFAVSMTLSDNQRDAIADYIRHLSLYYHHDPEFVHRVLGYLLSSNEGITEGELISVFSSNQPLLKRLAPETYHVNSSRKLPMAIWARLYFQLRNFLVTKHSDGYGVLNFFHREFRDATATAVPFPKIHDEFINQVESIVTGIQNTPFPLTRWGSLLAVSTALYAVLHPDEEQKAVTDFVSSLQSEEWIRGYVNFVEQRGSFYNQHNQMSKALVFNRQFCDLVDRLFYIRPAAWFASRIRSLMALAGTLYNLNRLNEAAELEVDAISLIEPPGGSETSELAILSVQILLNHSATLEKLNTAEKSFACKERAYDIIKHHIGDPEFDDAHLKCLIELSYHHAEHLGDTNTALSLACEALSLSRKLNIENQTKYIKYYVALLINTAIWVDDFDLAVSYEMEALEISKRLIKESRALWVIHYATCLNNLAFSFDRKGNLEDAERIFDDVLQDVRERYFQDKHRWTRAYSKSLTNLAQFYLNHGRVGEAERNFREAFLVVKEKYDEDHDDWVDQYLKKGMNLANGLKSAGKFTECAGIEREALQIVEECYLKSPEAWRDAYGYILAQNSVTEQCIGKINQLEDWQKKIKALACNHEKWNVFYKKIPL